MVERVLLASPRGYCAGVERAVETVEKALEHYGAPVYVRKQIVHNIHVVRDLEARGAIFVDEETEVPRGATVVYSAHGVAPTRARELGRARHNVIDATCPLVTKVHVQARRYADDGYTVILIGHAGPRGGRRDDGRGARRDDPRPGRGRGRGARPAGRHAHRLHHADDALGRRDLARSSECSAGASPQVYAPRKEDICYATSNRQWAVKEMLAEIDLLLVLGSKNSSNSNRLVDVARASGRRRAPDRRRDRDRRALARRRPHASGSRRAPPRPERLVTRLCDWFRARGVERIEPFQMIAEDVTFKLPVELRRELILAETQR